MKKKVIGFLIIVAMIVSITCVIAADSSNNEKPQNIQSITKNGVSIKFPSDWGLSKASSNCSLIALAKLDSIDSNGVGQVNIIIEKKPFEGDFNNFVNHSYTAMSKTGNFTFASSGEVAVGSYKGLIYEYTSDINGSVKQHQAIWINHNNEAYVILYSAPIDQFQGNLKVFDYVVHNFKIL